jgi:geranylgeranyl diphosphate synthase type II
VSVRPDNDQGRLVAYIEERRHWIDGLLEAYFPRQGGRPEPLYAAMRYAVHGGGKRMRPMLCIAGAELCGGHMEQVGPTACALECLHAFSLVHDDLPAIDDDDVRRGRPSCHVAFGEAVAILAGDALFAKAMELVAVQAAFSPPERVVRVLQVIADAAGTNGMAAGQVQDILSEGQPGDAETVAFIHLRKTASLLRAAAVSGAILAGADEVTVRALSNYGDALGLAFQITDDILGELGDPLRTGKGVGRDRARGKLTYTRVHGVERAVLEARRQVDEALDAIEPLGPRGEPLRWIAEFVLQRNH